MNTKLFFAAAALCAASLAPAFAQTTPDSGDKTKQNVDGVSVKTKAGEDGKMKVKSKDDAGNSMKATTKPYTGKMAKKMYGDDNSTSSKGKGMSHKGMKHKGMKRDSTMSSGSM